MLNTHGHLGQHLSELLSYQKPSTVFAVQESTSVFSKTQIKFTVDGSRVSMIKGGNHGNFQFMSMWEPYCVL